MEKRNQAAKLIIGAVVVIIAVLFLAGIVGGHDVKYKSTPLSRRGMNSSTGQKTAVWSPPKPVTASLSQTDTT